MKKELYPYQVEAIRLVFKSYSDGNRAPILQLPTGAGKTLTASELISHFIRLNPTKKVVFLVHRIELLSQFARTYLNQTGEWCGILDSNTKYLRSNCNVYAGMIETAYNRLKRVPNYFGNDIGLVVVDECHISTFDKIFQYFRNSLKLGLSATPMRMGKKNSLIEVYDDIISTVQIKDLISLGSLTPNKTWSVDTGIEYSRIKKRMGEFDENSIFAEYSKSKHIQNVVKYYRELCNGQKTIIFNSNIDHSQMVNDAFVQADLPSYHLDGKMNKSDRARILDWFASTPNAILNNVGILTMGFDEPSIINVIMNRPTTSLPLWLQCTGRGSRKFPNKDYFRIIDLGDNVRRLGDWSQSREWSLSPAKERGEGVAPTKTCPVCYYISHISCQVCPECGHIYTSDKPEADEKEIKLRLVVDLYSESVSVPKIINKVNRKGWKDYSGLFAIRDETKKFLEANYNEEVKEEIRKAYITKAKEWYSLQGIKPNYGHEQFILKILENQDVVTDNN